MRLGVRLGAVEARIDVGATGQQQAVEAVEDLVGIGHPDRVGGEDQRRPAGALDRVHVGAREHVREVFPGTPAGALDRRRDADHGPGHEMSLRQDH